MTVKKVIIE